MQNLKLRLSDLSKVTQLVGGRTGFLAQVSPEAHVHYWPLLCSLGEGRGGKAKVLQLGTPSLPRGLWELGTEPRRGSSSGWALEGPTLVGGWCTGRLGELRADMLPNQTAPHSWELLRLPPCSGQELHPPGSPAAGAGGRGRAHVSAPPLPDQAAEHAPSTGQTTWVSNLALLLPAHVS